MTGATILVNGKVTDQLSARDRGLQFGDGVFETIACAGQRMPFWDRHMQRLARGCERLAMAMPDPDRLHDEALQVCAGQTRAIIKIILTRGESQRGYAFDADSSVTRIVSANPWPRLPASYWEEGIAVLCCKTQLARQPMLAGIKHLNRLEQVLARAELQGRAVQEGVLCDTAGYVVEATAHNLFLIKKNEFVTPSLTHAGVAGIMRGHLCEVLVNKGYTVQVTDVPLQALQDADSVFLCNSIHGIWPVRRFEEKTYTVHPLVRELMQDTAKDIPYP